MTQGLSRLTSDTISNIRLPLILGVIMVHSGFVEGDPYGPPSPLLNYLIAEEVTRTAVPLFFAISAYLLFRGVERFNMRWYVGKLRSRFHSLVIPYFIWNFIGFFCCFGNKLAEGVLSSQEIAYRFLYSFYPEVWIADSHNFFFAPLSYPADGPFWFLRTLIVYVFLSPLFYFILRRFGTAVIVLLTLYYLSSHGPRIVLLNRDAIMFFTLGAYLALRGIDPSKLVLSCRKLCTAICWVYVGLAIADALSAVYWRHAHAYLHPLQTYVGTVAVFIWFCRATQRGLRIKASGSLVFALFAIHMLIQAVLKNLGLFFAPEHWGKLVQFIYPFFIFVILAGGSWLIYRIIVALSPRLGRVLFGARDIPVAFRK